MFMSFVCVCVCVCVCGCVVVWVVLIMNSRVVCGTMVMIKVSVHPEGLAPREAAKAWYSCHFYITSIEFRTHVL